MSPSLNASPDRQTQPDTSTSSELNKLRGQYWRTGKALRLVAGTSTIGLVAVLGFWATGLLSSIGALPRVLAFGLTALGLTCALTAIIAGLIRLVGFLQCLAVPGETGAKQFLNCAILLPLFGLAVGLFGWQVTALALLAASYFMFPLFQKTIADNTGHKSLKRLADTILTLRVAEMTLLVVVTLASQNSMSQTAFITVSIAAAVMQIADLILSIRLNRGLGNLLMQVAQGQVARPVKQSEGIQKREILARA